MDGIGALNLRKAGFMNDHHLILGTLTDVITGERLDDTHDERFRQKIARLLLRSGGYGKKEITPRYRHPFRVENRQGEAMIDFVITLDRRICMLVKYAPGSLVTRHRPAVASSRVLAPYQIPVVVVTNGETADILDGADGRVTASGLSGIPERPALAALARGPAFAPVPPKTVNMAHGILYAFEIHGACNCDDTACDTEKGTR
jgi:Type I restriction enzyme R protein N terminus (HSDR_N)